MSQPKNPQTPRIDGDDMKRALENAERARQRLVECILDLQRRVAVLEAKP